MPAIIFNVHRAVRKLVAAGVPEQQAEVQAELMSESFVSNMEQLVTKDFLDARFSRLEARFERIDGKFRTLYWMLGVVIAVNVIPSLSDLIRLGWG